MSLAAAASTGARAAALATLRTSQLFIGGKWVPSASTYNVFDPTTGEVLAPAPAGTPADVDAAVKSAADAWKSWRWTAVEERAKVLRWVPQGQRSGALIRGPALGH
jgi:delta 1-pyrroline-5-carboxylate dehydrogenase